MTSSLAFDAARNRRLRKAGLSGSSVRVELDGDTLLLTGAGAKGGALRIEAAMVERLRCGFISGKHGVFHSTRIWWSSERKPLLIEPTTRHNRDYGRTMHGFAARVAAVRGIGAVERGITGFGAALTLALLMFPVLAFTAIAVALAEARDWMGWAAGGAAVWLFGVVALWHYFARQRPRPVRDLTELERQLPGFGGGL